LNSLPSKHFSNFLVKSSKPSLYRHFSDFSRYFPTCLIYFHFHSQQAPVTTLLTTLREHCLSILTDNFGRLPSLKVKQDNGSGQRLPETLHSTQAASVNPLHPNCYTSVLYSYYQVYTVAIRGKGFDHCFADKNVGIPVNPKNATKLSHRLIGSNTVEITMLTATTRSLINND